MQSLNENDVLKLITAESYRSDKQGTTVGEVADHFKVNKQVANRVLAGLVKEGKVTKVGSTSTGKKGRPATLFGLAPATVPPETPAESSQVP